jgi:acetyltransferase
LTPPRSTFAPSPDAAARAAAELGFPVALKAVTPDAIHKTELGAVALGLDSEAAVRDGAAGIGARLAAASVELTGFLVQEMVDGLEVIVGVREDDQFGPVMVVGLGGVFVEAIGDVALRLLPVTAEDAREMLGELRGAALLGAFRGAPPRDVDALVRAIVGLSDVYLDHRHHLSDLEINPLMVLAEGEGVRVVDLRPIRRSGNP